MIFSLFGTSVHPFNRLAAELDRIAEKRGLDIFVQNGDTKFDFKHCRHQAYMPHAEIAKHIAECEYVICQGGAGGISDGLRAGKKVIAVPRRLDLGETMAQQIELTTELEKAGCILLARDPDQIESLIDRLPSFEPKPIPKNRIASIIKDYLSKID